MSRDVSGTYTLPEAAFVPATVALSAKVNNNFSDIGTALTGSLARDGSGGMGANLAMNTNRITGLGNGVAATDAATFGQVQNRVVLRSQLACLSNTSVSNNVAFDFTWDTLTSNTLAASTAAPSTGFTCPVSGIYLIVLNFAFAANAAGLRTATIAAGVNTLASVTRIAEDGGETFSLSWAGYLDAAVIVKAVVFQNSGAALNAVGATSTNFTCTYLGAA